MPTREPDESLPRDLARSARDAAALLDDRIAAARPVPDFAAMLARARELAPDAVSEADVAHAATLPPVIPLAHAERSGPRDDAAALAPFTAALRAELDAKIAERRMASIPPPPLPRRGPRPGLVIGLAVAIAAALLLVFVRPTELGQTAAKAGVEANAAGDAAAGNEARRGDPAPERHVLQASHGESTTGETPGLPDSAAFAAATGDSTGEAVPKASEAKSAVGGDSVASRPRARVRPVAPGAGPSLEDQAQALWERGELAAAEQKLREVLALAGGSGRSELAYGDLFALVRQLRGADGQVEVWREYLRKFPAGRFADDARAGLCQRAAVEARGACWRDYLEHHPRGVHQQQAAAALADPEPSP